MAVLDIRSDLKQTLALNAIISSDTTTQGAILDTANFELGLMFALALTVFSAGQADLLIQESDDSGMSGATTVSGDQLIGSLPSLTAVNANGSEYATVGVISNKRYIRASVVSTDSADFTANLTATEKGEFKPVV